MMELNTALDDDVRAEVRAIDRAAQEREERASMQLIQLLYMTESQLESVTDSMLEKLLARVERIFQYSLLSDPDFVNDGEIEMWLAVAMFVNDLVHSCADAEEDAEINRISDYFAERASVPEPECSLCGATDLDEDHADDCPNRED